MATVVKANFRSSVSSYNTIVEQINNKHYKECYLFMGEEEFFIDKLSELIATTIVEPEDRELSQTIYYGSDTKVEEVLTALRSRPMFCDRNIVIVKEAQKLKDINQLQYYFNEPLESTIFVLCYKGGRLDKRSVLYKKIKEHGEIFDGVAAREWEIGEWINSQIRARGFTIEPVALSLLADFLGTSLTKIDNEITKLATRLATTNVKNIITQHIEDNIGISKDFNNFELTKALSQANKQRALMIADHFAQNPKDNPTVVTINALFTHFQRIFLLGLTVWKCRKNRAPLPSDADLSKQLGLPTPFFLKEYKEAVNHYPSSVTFKILGLIREYDAKSKGIGSISGGDSAVLKELLLKIFNVR
ncbi:MAG: DNA polymerase III subunit delta [Rikenellaceae bacterium]